jgi:hypothetical protein
MKLDITSISRTWTKFIIPKDDMKIIIAHCIYDEEQYLEKCLEDDLKINDLDIIHILDGPWKLGFISTVETKKRDRGIIK